MIEQRIRELLSARNLSPTQFADTIGISRPIVSHILSGRNKPSLEVVQKIVAAFPELSLSWLLNGSGPMLAAAPPKGPEMPAKRAARASDSSDSSTDATEPLEMPTVRPTMPTLAHDTKRPDQEAALPLPIPASAVSNTISDRQPAPASAKRIKRIIIFYHDGTFSDFQPES